MTLEEALIEKKRQWRNIQNQFLNRELSKEEEEILKRIEARLAEEVFELEAQINNLR